ncbi:flagellar assembly protein FliW [Egicoccus sp. AB-alg2]|uniref:flagellar assembly protein FliW n=1 Tax=Egicoccus sp. AB-alg2 TaxID=3242693 RepID=UPI00359CCF9B
MTSPATLPAGVEGIPMNQPDGYTVLRFTDGIPGFPDAHGFVLSDLTDDGTFQLLSSVEDPDLSLVVASPWLFFPDYAPVLPGSDQDVLGIERPEDAVLFCTVTADEETEALHLNLRAPFVANARTLAARQVVLDDTELPLRATVTAGG